MTDWMRDAACRDMDTEVFFPVRGSRDAADESVTRQVEYAKTICRGCPVLDACRAYILSVDLRYENDFGIWGGLTPEERHRQRFIERNERQRERRRRKRLQP